MKDKLRPPVDVCRSAQKLLPLPWCFHDPIGLAGKRDVYLEKQLEQFEWQLRTLKEALSANGSPERAELLKQHADEEACALVLGLLDKVSQRWRRLPSARADANPDANSQVRTETTADLNVLHERRSQAAAEGYERRETALKRGHEEEKSQLAETFQAAEDALKVTAHAGSGGVRWGQVGPPAAACSAAFVSP